MYETVTTEELRECPFCGKLRAAMYKDHPTDFYFFVRCKVCGARTQSEYTEEEAAKQWNRRSYR
jgi:Lar family restriction alleviation protein